METGMVRENRIEELGIGSVEKFHPLVSREILNCFSIFSFLSWVEHIFQILTDTQRVDFTDMQTSINSFAAIIKNMTT